MEEITAARIAGRPLRRILVTRKAIEGSPVSLPTRPYAKGTLEIVIHPLDWRDMLSAIPSSVENTAISFTEFRGIPVETSRA